MLGFTTGMDGSTAKRNQTLGLQVMEAALLGSGHTPKQDFEDVAAFKAYFATKGTILIDATEQRTQRPVDADYQKAIGPPMRYSGKKKRIR